MAGHMERINKFKFSSCKSLKDKYVLLKDTNNEISNDIKKATYKVDTKNILASFLAFKALSLATKQERAVGIPVVVRAIQIIKKLKTM